MSRVWQNTVIQYKQRGTVLRQAGIFKMERIYISNVARDTYKNIDTMKTDPKNESRTQQNTHFITFQ